MDTDLVLDLFRRTNEDEGAPTAAAKKKEKEAGGFGQKNILRGLEDLPPEDEYQGLDLSSFMGSLSRWDNPIIKSSHSRYVLAVHMDLLESLVQSCITW